MTPADMQALAAFVFGAILGAAAGYIAGLIRAKYLLDTALARITDEMRKEYTEQVDRPYGR